MVHYLQCHISTPSRNTPRCSQSNLHRATRSSYLKYPSDAMGDAHEECVRGKRQPGTWLRNRPSSEEQLSCCSRNRRCLGNSSSSFKSAERRSRSAQDAPLLQNLLIRCRNGRWARERKNIRCSTGPYNLTRVFQRYLPFMPAQIMGTAQVNRAAARPRMAKFRCRTVSDISWARLGFASKYNGRRQHEYVFEKCV
jgi:hypothetical protein